MKETIERVMKAFSQKHEPMTPEQEGKIRDEIPISSRSSSQSVRDSSPDSAARNRVLEIFLIDCLVLSEADPPMSRSFSRNGRRLDLFPPDNVEYGRMTPQECVLDAVLRAQGILAEYIEPGSHDCEKTINRLFDIFDDEQLMIAVNRLNLDMVRPRLSSETSANEGPFEVSS
jgi:hypothetical protein